MRTSFIIPSYNHRSYLDRCLQSVLENRVPGMELIIYDDGSSDGSAELIGRWMKLHGERFSKSIFIKNSKNHGLPSVLNEAIGLACGEVITGVGSDDYVLPGGIEAKLVGMDANRRWLGAFSDAIAVGLNDEVYSESLLESSGLNRRSLDSDTITKTILKKWIQPMNLQFWRRRAFKAHGGDFEFDESLYCEDLSFALWALSQNGFGYIAEKCIAYRCRSWPQIPPATDKCELAKIYNDLARCYESHAGRYPEHIAGYMKAKCFYYNALAKTDYRSASRMLVRLDAGPARRLYQLVYSVIWPFVYFKPKSVAQLLFCFFLNEEERRYVKKIEASGLFDTDFYRAQRPKNLAVQLMSIVHYVCWGERQGLQPNKRFVPMEYVQKNNICIEEGGRPLLHYLSSGVCEPTNSLRDKSCQ